MPFGVVAVSVAVSSSEPASSSLRNGRVRSLVPQSPSYSLIVAPRILCAEPTEYSIRNVARHVEPYTAHDEQRREEGLKRCECVIIDIAPLGRNPSPRQIPRPAKQAREEDCEKADLPCDEP